MTNTFITSAGLDSLSLKKDIRGVYEIFNWRQTVGHSVLTFSIRTSRHLEHYKVLIVESN